jgi:hypothetical protein
MAIEAYAFDNAGNFELTMEGGSAISLFRQAQSRFGHCLGRITEEGLIKGWRFARCYGDTRCSRIEIINVILEERMWRYEDSPNKFFEKEVLP